MTEARKNETYLILFVGFMLLVVGMGVGGPIGILTIVSAIVLFLIVIVISLIRPRKPSKGDGEEKPDA